MSDQTFFKGLMDESLICAYCGYCRTVCPTYVEVGWESCSPRGRIQLIRLLLAGTPLSAGQMTRLYQCTLCGHCAQVCSTRIDLRQFWLEARAQTVSRELSPQGLATARDNVARTGNVYGYQNDERAGWVEYMDDAPADLYQRDQAEVVYFVGCSSSFSPRAQRIAESFVRVLDAAQVSFTILGEGEVCCGFPLLAAGMHDQAQTLIEHNLERVRMTGARTVVFTCPACRMMWLEEYARHLPGIRLLHATELLAELMAARPLPLKDVNRVVTYHDPCDLARNGGVYDAPRQVLAAIPGLQFVEVHERRERGLCCGGGGDLEMVDPALAQRVAQRTASKLAATGAQVIATACPQCVRTLARGTEQAVPGVEVKDLVELLAEALDI
ncbi:MAG: (Fe-S)-binding protein [Anaerolineae bacterium]|jgi:Fe-S oxidoreductase|nr:(Fe-S)-binding protein [Anaerolineae bacterium]MDH7473749.1 (Fe-S)-binding protein [Anaerolineae bacterium]